VSLPNPPPEVSSSSSQLVTGSTVTLSVPATADPQGDTLTYCFELYADSLLTNLLADTCGILEENGVVSWQIQIEPETASFLARHAYYYWRVRSCAREICSQWSRKASFYVSSQGISVPFAFPNPFLPQHERIRFANVPPNSVIKVLNQEGRLVIRLETGPGEWEKAWDGTDSEGRPAPSGIYTYAVSGTVKFTGKLAIVR